MGQFIGAFAQARRHIEQDAMDFRLLLFQQADKIVVLLDGLQRLDEHGLAAGRRAMGDALHSAALLHLHRDDEAFAANGDQFLLHRSTFGKPPQIGAQRLLDRALLLLDLAPDARQFGRGAVVQSAVGQDLVAEVTQQESEIGNALGELVYGLPLVLNRGRGMKCDLAPLGGTVGEQKQIANLDDLQRGSGDACLVDQLRRIEQTVKVKTPSGPQVAAQLFGKLLLALDPLAVTRGRELHHPVVPERRGGIDGEELPELIEFQNAFAGVWDEAGRIHRCGFYGTGGARLHFGRLRDRVATGVAAPRLTSISHFTRRSRAGLTALPPRRGWFDRLSDGLCHRKILWPLATQVRFIYLAETSETTPTVACRIH